MYWFTADEHYYHRRMIEYADRPFVTISHMNYDLIERFNSVVKGQDMTVHAGDFSFGTKEETSEIIKYLNGSHIFLRGCHDYWLPKSAKYLYQKTIEGKQIVVCHYCMRTWKASHYNSWHLFAHSHGRLEPVGKSHDIGVDNNNYFPVSFEQICEIMRTRPDNFNLVKR